MCNTPWQSADRQVLRLANQTHALKDGRHGDRHRLVNNPGRGHSQRLLGGGVILGVARWNSRWRIPTWSWIPPIWMRGGKGCRDSSDESLTARCSVQHRRRRPRLGGPTWLVCPTRSQAGGDLAKGAPIEQHSMTSVQGTAERQSSREPFR